jgi:hypothetical protein
MSGYNHYLCVLPPTTLYSKSRVNFLVLCADGHIIEFLSGQIFLTVCSCKYVTERYLFMAAVVFLKNLLHSVSFYVEFVKSSHCDHVCNY